jgi:hypothetical protein
MRDIWEALWASVPFYVTRKNADGVIASYNIAAILGLYIVLFNVLVWGIVGAIAAVGAL